MLLAIAQNETGIGSSLLRHMKCSGADLIADAVRSFDTEPPIETEVAVSFGDEYKIMLALEERRARANHEHFVGTHQVLFAMLERDGIARDFLLKRSVTTTSLSTAMTELASKAPLQD